MQRFLGAPVNSTRAHADCSSAMLRFTSPPR
jgi:hypothetical protein